MSEKIRRERLVGDDDEGMEKKNDRMNDS